MEDSHDTWGYVRNANASAAHWAAIALFSFPNSHSCPPNVSHERLRLWRTMLHSVVDSADGLDIPNWGILSGYYFNDYQGSKYMEWILRVKCYSFRYVYQSSSTVVLLPVIR